jgi:DNA polymerase-3 subunit gamma/tau
MNSIHRNPSSPPHELPVLARKWRPKTFAQLVGQSRLAGPGERPGPDRLHHAFLFTGTRGVGKTTIARILAKCLNCERGVSSRPCGECGSCVDVDEGRFVDMIEIDAASRTGVDDMRELLEAVQYTPSRGRFKVYIIDEVHMLSTSSFNALLKTLEEPPPHVKFVLATTEPEKVPVTILSRCLQFNLRRLLPDQVAAYLKALVAAEGIDAEPAALTVLARVADGSMRDGLSLLDQAIAFGGGKLLMSDLEKMLGLVDHRHVVGMVLALAAGDAARLLAIVGELVAQSRDLGTALANLAEVLHRVTLVQCVPGYRDPDRSDWDAIEELAGELSAEDAQLFYQIAVKGRSELPLAPDPRTGLEMTLLRMLAFRPAAVDAAGPGSEAGPATNRRAGPRSGSASPKARPAARAAAPAASGSTPPQTRAPAEVRNVRPTPPLPGRQPPTQRLPRRTDVAARQLDLSGPVGNLRATSAENVFGQRWEFLIAPHCGISIARLRGPPAPGDQRPHRPSRQCAHSRPGRQRAADCGGARAAAAQPDAQRGRKGHSRRPDRAQLADANGREAGRWFDTTAAIDPAARKPPEHER